MSVFQGALARLPGGGSSDSLRDYLALEMRLTSIEFGEGARLKGELEEHLKAAAPSGFWLLTAAALALQEKRIPDAMDALGRAKAILPPAQFDELTSDYYFRGFAKEPGLGSLLPPPDPARDEIRRRGGAYFIDPSKTHRARSALAGSRRCFSGFHQDGWFAPPGPTKRLPPFA